MSSLQKWASPINKSCKVNEDDVLGALSMSSGLKRTVRKNAMLTPKNRPCKELLTNNK
jgi:hypothetical protein